MKLKPLGFEIGKRAFILNSSRPYPHPSRSSNKIFLLNILVLFLSLLQTPWISLFFYSRYPLTQDSTLLMKHHPFIIFSFSLSPAFAQRNTFLSNAALSFPLSLFLPFSAVFFFLSFRLVSSCSLYSIFSSKSNGKLSLSFRIRYSPLSPLSFVSSIIIP